MSARWWGQDSDGAGVTPGGEPRLGPESREAIVEEIGARVPAFTPEWRRHRAGDAGGALAQLFGEQMEIALARLHRLPEKLLVEYLRAAGVAPLPATAARAMVAFTVAPSAPQPVLLAQGFQVGGRPASGGDLVVFETERTLFATPSALAELHAQEGGTFRDLTGANGGGSTFLPFGKGAQPGRALHLGLTVTSAAPSLLSIGVIVAAPQGVPRPVGLGGTSPPRARPRPLLRWEVLDGGSHEPAEVVLDETGGLARSGVLELRLPRRWRPGRPVGLDGTVPRLWLRLRVMSGRFEEDPALSLLAINATMVTAARTIRDEVLEPVAGGGGRRLRLSQTPVIPRSLILAVDEGRSELTLASGEGGEAEQGGAEAAPASGEVIWEQVEDLEGRGPEDRVYVLDPAAGEVSFGDGQRGAALPRGFRNVRALRYQVGGGAAGAVEAGAISVLIGSAPFVTGVSNPLRSSGGADAEPEVAARSRGPEEIRSRGRAVTSADYALLARRAPAAQVARAHAVAGLHPSFPGRALPGVVGVIVVPPDRGEGPPMPDEAALRAVAAFLSERVAPAGVEVVASAPRYHRVRVEAVVEVNPALDAGGVVRAVLGRIDAYLHPLRGGDDGEGWPFGGAVRYAELLRQIMSVSGVQSVPSLHVLVDGLRGAACADVTISPNALLWPEGHEIVPRVAEVRP